ncbi:methionine ABC transporter substrate-binding protein [Virgibacillus profundi]|uniref:Lipoprotein n=1 Tax=Virgibacillus profundi TaxID=2024555 RepID=A0A2A2I9J0_9BACI|nr:MetQ/NlpA family ABC transporter substrate-binding protein [Virgibacillus profundi]PAV28671.1 methionine ABC transporter substrate-binding protein [Virgibacillus profundi]PXY52839.1 MetQ/NlpA family ABC transporter substrate-binding protein [Virgibacillus profundi]
MKKFLVFLSVLFVLVLAACGGGDSEEDTSNENTSGDSNAESEENVELIVGASSVPHSEILEEAKPLLEEEGITLTIEEYQDYVFPNDDLASGDLDANYFQHIPFLKQTIGDTGYELENIGGVHVEPMGVYSKGIESVDDIEEGTEVILSNSVPDHGRVLALFESEGLITLDESVEKSEATIDDIVENPKNLKFSPDYTPEILPELYHSEENTLVVINTNFAIGADLNPLEDALFIEGEDSEYVNIVAARAEDKDNEALNTLVDVLQSEEIQDFIIENYEGAIVPVGGKN